MPDEKNALWAGMRNAGIKIEKVAPRAQFLNFSERAWQEFKKLMMGMRRTTSKSIYAQNDTLTELQAKFNLASNILSTMPLLVKSKNQKVKFVMKQSLLKPFMGAELVQKSMHDLACVLFQSPWTTGD